MHSSTSFSRYIFVKKGMWHDFFCRKMTEKFGKTNELPGAFPPGPHQGFALDPDPSQFYAYTTFPFLLLAWL